MKEKIEAAKSGCRGWTEAGHLLGNGIRLLFTDRSGGVSCPPYYSLNLSERCGDDPRAVDSNRKAVACALGLQPGRLVFMEQVHGVRVRRVGRGSGGGPRVVHGCDGLFTTEQGLALAALTADCVPLAVAFPSSSLVAVLHAGWRGTIGDIAGSFLELMRKELSLNPLEARVVMGPSIGPCCYLVEEGRARLFVEKYGEESGVVREDGGFRVDLRRANRINLVRAGAREQNIHVVAGCTSCDERYFSFRRDGVTGRQGAFILMEKESH